MGGLRDTNCNVSEIQKQQGMQLFSTEKYSHYLGVVFNSARQSGEMNHYAVPEMNIFRIVNYTSVKKQNVKIFRPSSQPLTLASESRLKAAGHTTLPVQVLQHYSDRDAPSFLRGCGPAEA